MPRPHPAEELFFCEEQAVGFQQDQKEIEDARADYDRNTVGQQLPPAQQLDLDDLCAEIEQGAGA